MAERTGCNIVDENPLNQTVGNCSVVTTTTPDPCSAGVTPSCAPNASCDIWELVKSPENCLIASYIDESLRIGGADINVYKLLGVHEQGSLEDLTGFGSPISGGSHPNFPTSNAFDKYITEWHSLQTGTDVTLNAFLGYDFGPIRLKNDSDRLQYGIETFLKHEISTIKIKQGCESINRVTKARVERSPDGLTWYGVALIDLPDCDGLVTISFKQSVPSRFWRIRPVVFNGSQNDPWIVQALQLIDYVATDISNIQDSIFLENRDRDYSETAIRMKASYAPVDVQANSERWGFVGTESYILETSFMATLAKIGRPFVIGDILELPSEKQYTPGLRAVLKYVEISDVAWSVNGYTAMWVPLMQRLICKPALASQETQQIFGKLTPDVDSTGLMDINDGNSKKYQDYTDTSQAIEAAANTMKPEDGIDYANIPKLSQELMDYGNSKNINMTKLDRNRNQYGIDAMPPNGLPYTEADAFPLNPKNGDYHRLTYTHVQKNIPARLYRFSTMKKQWVYLETDHRAAVHNAKTQIEEYKSDLGATSVSKVDKKLQDTL